MPDFPWDMLKAETLRTLCRDLQCLKWVTTREAMIDALKKIEEYGVDETLTLLQAPSKSRKRVAKRLSTLLPKSPPRPVVSNYNTRFKGTKRLDQASGVFPRRYISASISSAVPGRFRKPMTKARGRPRKNLHNQTSRKKRYALSSIKRQVFDGVVLLRHRIFSKGKQRAVEQADDEIGDEDAEGDMEVEDVEDHGLVSLAESSLASSNKENELVDEYHYENIGEVIQEEVEQDTPHPIHAFDMERGPAGGDIDVKQVAVRIDDVFADSQTNAATSEPLETLPVEDALNLEHMLRPVVENESQT